MLNFMVYANDEPPKPEQPEQHGLQGKGASKRLIQEAKEEPLVPLGIAVGAVASILLAYMSYYYRRQMRVMQIQEREKAIQSVQARFYQLIGASGLFSIMTAGMGYGMCRWQTPKIKPPHKKRDKAKRLANGENNPSRNGLKKDAENEV